MSRSKRSSTSSHSSRSSRGGRSTSRDTRSESSMDTIEVPPSRSSKHRRDSGTDAWGRFMPHESVRVEKVERPEVYPTVEEASDGDETVTCVRGHDDDFCCEDVTEQCIDVEEAGGVGVLYQCRVVTGQDVAEDARTIGNGGIGPAQGRNDSDSEDIDDRCITVVDDGGGKTRYPCAASLGESARDVGSTVAGEHEACGGGIASWDEPAEEYIVVEDDRGMTTHHPCAGAGYDRATLDRGQSRLADTELVSASLEGSNPAKNPRPVSVEDDPEEGDEVAKVEERLRRTDIRAGKKNAPSRGLSGISLETARAIEADDRSEDSGPSERLAPPRLVATEREGDRSTDERRTGRGARASEHNCAAPHRTEPMRGTDVFSGADTKDASAGTSADTAAGQEGIEDVADLEGVSDRHWDIPKEGSSAPEEASWEGDRAWRDAHCGVPSTPRGQYRELAHGAYRPGVVGGETKSKGGPKRGNGRSGDAGTDGLRPKSTQSGGTTRSGKKARAHRSEHRRGGNTESRETSKNDDLGNWLNTDEGLYPYEVTREDIEADAARKKAKKWWDPGGVSSEAVGTGKNDRDRSNVVYPSVYTSREVRTETTTRRRGTRRTSFQSDELRCEAERQAVFEEESFVSSGEEEPEERYPQRYEATHPAHNHVGYPESRDDGYLHGRSADPAGQEYDLFNPMGESYPCIVPFTPAPPLSVVYEESDDDFADDGADEDQGSEMSDEVESTIMDMRVEQEDRPEPVERSNPIYPETYPSWGIREETVRESHKTNTRHHKPAKQAKKQSVLESVAAGMVRYTAGATKSRHKRSHKRT